MNQAALQRYLAGNKLKRPASADQDALFELRLTANLPIIQHFFFKLYPGQASSYQKLLKLLPKLFEKRPDHLKRMDVQRMAEGNWYQSEKMVGMQLYVDRYNKNLKGLEERLPYIQDLGVNFLHLMPITTRPEGPNDGGYAVSSYTEVDKRFGTKADLGRLVKKMHEKEMYLMLDFVVNHTSDEYPWAKKAMSGSKKHQDYYYTYPDRTIPDEYEKSLPEVFPESSPGNFTYIQEMERWVMTVFNDYQWDLNYSNPEVFMEMFKNLVSLVNLGVDMVRFDALAFLWKKIGTISQNLPEAHWLITLFRMCLQTVAPGVVLLAEAIVAPKEIIKYFGEGIAEGNECEVAYNATLMALLWNSVATKKTLLLYRNLQNVPAKPKDGTWINYVRCHDDIGLGFEDRYIYELGWDASAHRKFLLDYYSQNLGWSPAVGQIFMFNPRTGDGRITGSTASLLGLEKGINSSDESLIAASIDKIILLYGIVLSYGGIPMIYAGDEIGTINDYSYLNEEELRDDSRWLNRPIHNWEASEAIHRDGSVAARIYNRLRHLIQVRKQYPLFSGTSEPILHTPNSAHLFIFERKGNGSGKVLVIANFDDRDHVVDSGWLDVLGYVKDDVVTDLATGEKKELTSGLFTVRSYQILWLLGV